ncbi:MAG: hypothetical protein ACRYFV_08980 [Janthinobacterium lividum]
MEWKQLIATQGLLVVMSTAVFLVLERKFPGRELPAARARHWRALAINGVQLMLIGLGGLTWNHYFRQHSLLHVGH